MKIVIVSLLRYLQEFLGPEFRLLKQEDIRTVTELVAKHPEKEKGITLALGDHVANLIVKGEIKNCFFFASGYCSSCL